MKYEAITTHAQRKAIACGAAATAVALGIPSGAANAERTDAQTESLIDGKRRLVAALGIAMLLALTATPAHAIRNPTPDGAGHPYVGVLVDEGGRPNLYDRACTGTLVAPQLVVTAAHCYYGWPPDHVWVSFDDVYTPTSEAPPIHGTAVVYPGFRQGAKYFVHDVAVIHLDTPVDIAPAQLPSAGLLDSIDLKDQLFDVVGYGRTRSDVTGGPSSVDPNIDPVVRYAGTVEFQNLLLEGQWISYSQKLAQDESGVCRGDSGSAQYLAGTDVMVSLTSTVDPTCVSWGRGPRLDTPAIREFLASQGAPLP